MVENATQSHITVKTSASNMAKFGSKGNDVYVGGTSGSTNIIFKNNITSTDHPADSGTETVRIDSSGRVGIGTDNPTAPLAVMNSSDPEIRFGYNETQDHKISWDSSKVFLEADPDNANGSSALGFKVDGTEAARFDSSGHFGIGAQSPDGTLHVHSGTAGSVTANGNADDLIVESSGTTGISILTPDASHGYIMWGSPTSNEGAIIRYRDSDNLFTIGTEDSDGALAFRSGAGSEAARIDSSGRLLVGTTTEGDTAADNLTIADSGASGITIRSGSSSTGNIYFSDATSGSGEYDGYIQYSQNDRHLIFGTATSERLRIDSSGRLLIGTTTAGDSAADDLTIANSGHAGITIRSSSSSAAGIYFADGTSGSQNYQGIIQYYHATDELQFYTNYGASSDVRMRINSSGQILIGVASASTNINNHTFQAAGNCRLGSVLTAGRSGGDYDGIGYNVGWQSSTNNYKYVASDTAAFIRFGRTGGRIQTLTAAAGTAGNSISFTDGPYVTSGGTSWSSSSDERLKTNLSPIENGLAKVATLRAVTGRFLTDSESKSRSFLIAQDVQAVLPEAVDTAELDNLGLDYPAVIPLLVAALKEAKNKIETLETKVAALEG